MKNAFLSPNRSIVKSDACKCPREHALSLCVKVGSHRLCHVCLHALHFASTVLCLMAVGISHALSSTSHISCAVCTYFPGVRLGCSLYMHSYSSNTNTLSCGGTLIPQTKLDALTNGGWHPNQRALSSCESLSQQGGTQSGEMRADSMPVRWADSTC